MAEWTRKKNAKGTDFIGWVKKVEGHCGEASKMRRAVCNALIVGFCDKRNYTIPSAAQIKQAVSFAVGKICRMREECGEASGDEIAWELLEMPENLGKRVRYGIEEMFSTEFETKSELDKYMIPNGRFENKFVRGKGVRYRFTCVGELRKARKEIETYWTADEKRVFLQLGKYMNEYLKNAENTQQR